MSAAGEFQLFNRRILEYFGKTPEELKSWATSDVVHPDDLSRVIAAFTSSIDTGHVYDIEHRCRRADGPFAVNCLIRTASIPMPGPVTVRGFARG